MVAEHVPATAYGWLSNLNSMIGVPGKADKSDQRGAQKRLRMIRRVIVDKGLQHRACARELGMDPFLDHDSERSAGGAATQKRIEGGVTIRRRSMRAMGASPVRAG